MSPLSRRSFVAHAAALLPASQLAFSRDKLEKNNLGVQLYTVRNIIDQDPGKVLAEIRDIGYTEIEATADNIKKDWPAIADSKLQPVSVHLDLDPTNEQFADVKQKGFQYAVIPYVPPDKRGDLNVMKALAASFQKAGERAKAHGLQLCYHNHAFEFEPMNGTMPLEILMGETKPDDVKLEMDIFWVTVAGHNPVELLRKYSGRVPLIHLKDKMKGVPAEPQYNEKVPKEAFKEIGNGTINMPAVLAAADHAGAQHYFVEQDQTPDPINSLRESYTYLRAHFKDDRPV
jgi:sugar phosphate isomerase/epimerase